MWLLLKMNKVLKLIQDYYWWYFTKEAACYRTVWGWTLSRIPTLYSFENMYKIERLIDSPHLSFKTFEVINDYKPGVSYIHFNEPVIIKSGKYWHIPKVLKFKGSYTEAINEAKINKEIDDNKKKYRKT